MSDCCDDCEGLEVLQGTPGPPGTNGVDGRGYDATSSTSLTITNHVGKVLTISTNKAYLAGSRVRIVSRANTANYMEGDVIGYNPTTGVMSVGIFNISGSGTFTDWNISIAGVPGTDGTNGTNGTDGVAILYNQQTVANSGDTGGVTTKIHTNQIAPNTLDNDGDEVTLQLALKCKSTNFTNGVIGKVIIGTQLSGEVAFSANEDDAIFDITIDRVSSSSYRLCCKQITSSSCYAKIFLITGVDFTQVINVEFWANTNGDAGGISLEKSYADFKTI